MGQLINLYVFHAVVFWLFESMVVSALEECMSTVTEIWGILLLGITSCLISNHFQDAGTVIQCCSEDVICSKWHSHHWSGTWFQAQFLSNRLGIVQNGSKPTSQMAPFTPNRGQFAEFLNACGEILSGTDMVLPDLVLAVFWVVAQISAFWDGSCSSIHL